VSVCWILPWAMQTWLNWLRCLLGTNSCGPKQPCL